MSQCSPSIGEGATDIVGELGLVAECDQLNSTQFPSLSHLQWDGEENWRKKK